MTALSVFLFLLSCLAVFKAPAKPLWYAAIVATEWGHWLAVVSAVILLWNGFLCRRWGTPSWVVLMATLLFLSPLLRAGAVALQLPSQLQARFGQHGARGSPEAPTLQCPLSWSNLYTGVRSPEVRVTSEVYETTDGHSLWVDLYRPIIINVSLPGVVVIHSGSWQGGERGEFSALNRYLAARGYLVASIDYRLAPGAIFPAQRDDVFSAIRYLKDHAKVLGLDPKKLVLLGRSAGGQIALSAAYAQKDPAIQGVIALYTPNDLVWGYSIPGNPLIMNSQKVIETYLGGTPAQVPGVYEAASPLLAVNAHTPPTLLIHGDRDELVWAEHDVRLSRRLSEFGRPFLYVRLPWATHGCDANFSGPSGQLSTYAIERFLAAVLSPPQREPHV